MQANEKSNSVPLQDIMKELYHAATSERPDASADQPLPINARLKTRWAPIKNALDRAYRKSTVRAVKPLRRLLRNQEAVNDSIIEALFALSAQTEELVQEMTELQRRINVLETQLAKIRPQSGNPDHNAKAE